MRTIRFYGSSDDLVQVRDTDSAGRVASDEFSPGDGNHGILKVAVPDGEGLYVVVQYLGHVSGTWTVGVAPLDGQHPMPGWPMVWRFGAEDHDSELAVAMQGLGPAPCAPYSAHLTIDVPDDAEVAVVRPVVLVPNLEDRASYNYS